MGGDGAEVSPEQPRWALLPWGVARTDIKHASGVESRLGVESSILDLWCSAVAMHLHVRVLRLRLCVENVWRILGYQYELYVYVIVFEIPRVENVRFT